MSLESKQDAEEVGAVATDNHPVADPPQARAELPIEDERRDDYLPDDLDDNPADDYRELSTAAVASIALGVLSPLAIFDWWLGLIPLAGLCLGAIALVKIRSHRGEYTGAALAWAGAVLAGLFWVSGIARLSYVYATEVPEGYARIDYSLLQPRPGDLPDSIPPEANELDGKQVFIKGYVYPGQRQDGITQFLLVRDQGTCCFGGNPKVTDRILVQLTDASGFSFSSRLFKVAGTFHVAPPTQAPDATGAVFYRLDEAMLR
jgi:hypothetical protein